MSTKIEWADMTINPVVGCSKCSPACDNCYAERFAARLAKNPVAAAKYTGVVDERGKWTGKLSPLSDLSCFDRLSKKPARVFVGSMTDLFHPGLKDGDGQGWRAMLDIFHMHPQHIFITLTKRPERMARDIDWLIAQDGDLPKNYWPGVTIWDQKSADEFIPILLETPAAKRIVSIEPQLGPVNVGKWLYGSYECGLSCGHRQAVNDLPGLQCTKCGFTGPDDYATWGDGDCAECPKCHQDGCCGEIEEVCPECGTYMVREHPDTPCIDWVICGPETGPGKRPFDLDWARSLRDQCHADYCKTPFFFKRNPDGSRLLDGVEYSEFPEAKHA